MSSHLVLSLLLDLLRLFDDAAQFGVLGGETLVLLVQARELLLAILVGDLE